MFFMGTFTPKLDEKGRIFLPAKFRDRLSEGLVMTPGQEHCVVVWPEDVFGQEAERVEGAPITDLDAREYVRLMFSAAESGTPDKQGRLMIPATLREWASLERDVVVIGAMKRVEIWEPAAWAAYRDRGLPGFASLDTGAAGTPPAGHR